MNDDRERLLAGAVVTVIGAFCAVGDDPRETQECIELAKVGLGMMDLDTDMIPGQTLRKVLVPVARKLLAEFAPVESVMEG